MAKIQTVTHVPIQDVTVTIGRGGEGEFRATLTANGEPWTGTGRTVTTALMDALNAIAAEKRSHEKGRPDDRYRIARSL